MSNKEFQKELPVNRYATNFMTEDVPKTQRQLIETITVSSYFGGDASAFYTEHSRYGSVNIVINATITQREGMIIEFEGYFKSDGLSIKERGAKWTDVIELYVTYLKPVSYRITTESIGRNFFSLDLNPMPGHQYTSAHEEGFKYIPMEQEVKSTGMDIRERKSMELGTDPVYLYMIPQLVRNPQTGEVIEGTQRSRTVFHTDQGEPFNPNHVKYNKALLPLAELMNQNPMKLEEDSVYLDTRRRGGGIKPDVTNKEIELQDKKSLYNWDIGFFDGQAYQENGVFVVQVDANRFKGLTDEEVEAEKRQIEQAVEKYKAFGVLPFIEFNQDEEIKIGELIANGEFEKGLPCGYFSEGLSQGNYSIIYKELGAGDNYVMQLIDDATFGIRIPGFNFNKNESYRFEIKGMKDPNIITMTRSAGEITVKYEDGDEEVYRMSDFTQAYWTSVHQDFKTKENKEVREVSIEINDNGNRNGVMYYDYVSLISLGNIEGNQEVVEL